MSSNMNVSSVCSAHTNSQVKKDTIQVNISDAVDSNGNKITGLNALAKAYGMDYDDFLRLNNIDPSQKWSYQAKAGEKFKVTVDSPILTDVTVDKPDYSSPSSSMKYKMSIFAAAAPVAICTTKAIKSGTALKSIPKSVFTKKTGLWTLAAAAIGFGIGYLIDKLSTKKTDSSSETEPANNKVDPSLEEDALTITPTESNPDRKIKLLNGKEFTAEGLRKDAIKGAKKSKEYKGIKEEYLTNINRPRPYINENGKIEAAACVKQPTNPDGPLKGKVVIVNPGHGGYNGNGMFDAGAVHYVKNAKGDKVPIEEWQIANNYSKDLIKSLQAKGATVVVVSGAAIGEGSMAKSEYLENLLQGKRSSQDVRDIFKNTSKSDMAFISLHIESIKKKPNMKGCTIRATKNDTKDDELANNIISNINQTSAEFTPTLEHNNYYVTRSMGTEIPSVLLEIGNIANPEVTDFLQSPKDRTQYTTAIANGIESTLLNR